MDLEQRIPRTDILFCFRHCMSAVGKEKEKSIYLTLISHKENKFCVFCKWMRLIGWSGKMHFNNYHNNNKGSRTVITDHNYYEIHRMKSNSHALIIKVKQIFEISIDKL